ncbi:MAG: serine hydrolase, partial [Planctomycetota bacterium]
MGHRKAFVVFLSLFALIHAPNTHAQKGELRGFDEFVNGVMKEWQIPGLAIAVVKDGEVIHSKGYGYRDVENNLPVTPNTLFAIGSITKSFTVSALGILVDEGKLEWDEPVRTYLPGFQLKDEVATKQMTAVDLVSHRSGLPRHDLLWYGSSLTRKEMFSRLRYLEPSKEFRSTYQYQNLMFMTAGYLAGQISGMKWKELVRARILEPLGMERSNFSVNDSQQDDDFALAYRKQDDEVKKVPFRNIDEIGPAGSINSSVSEMIRYVQFHLNKGKIGEDQLLSENNAEKMQTPQMVIAGAIQYDELGHNSYGMGLGISTYQGHKLVQHGGGIDGFISRLAFMPRKKIGLIILTNLSGNNPVPAIVSRNVFDRLLGMKQVDWVGRIKERQEKAEKSRKEAEEKEYSDRKEGTSPTHALADYVGSYEHPGYGVVEIAQDNSHLIINFNFFSADLEHYHYDIFKVPEDSERTLEGTRVTFFYNKKGDIDRIT